MEEQFNYVLNKLKGKGTVCQCLRCGEIFGWDEVLESKSGLVPRKVCPCCKGTFTIIHFGMPSIEGYYKAIDWNYNINTDSRYYSYQKVNKQDYIGECENE